MQIPTNVNIAKMNNEKVLVYRGIEFIGRIENYNIYSRNFYFAESPQQDKIAICQTPEDAINYLISIV